MRRRHVLGMAVAAAAGSGLARSALAAGESVKIAVVVPLAGAFAANGQDILAGARLAAEEINKAGGIKSLGGRQIELQPADAEQSPEQAVTAARRALNGDRSPRSVPGTAR